MSERRAAQHGPDTVVFIVDDEPAVVTPMVEVAKSAADMVRVIAAAGMLHEL